MPFDTGGKYTMESYKSEFIEFMVESDVLKFGDFTLKSGRKSPFFMNAVQQFPRSKETHMVLIFRVWCRPYMSIQS